MTAALYVRNWDQFVAQYCEKAVWLDFDIAGHLRLQGRNRDTVVILRVLRAPGVTAAVAEDWRTIVAAFLKARDYAVRPGLYADDGTPPTDCEFPCVNWYTRRKKLRCRAVYLGPTLADIANALQNIPVKALAQDDDWVSWWIEETQFRLRAITDSLGICTGQLTLADQSQTTIEIPLSFGTREAAWEIITGLHANVSAGSYRAGFVYPNRRSK